MAEVANTNKLEIFETVLEKKRKLKDENSRRRSSNVNTLPVPTSKKPLRSANSVNTDVATGPPWYEYPQPRFHEDPLVAIKALNQALGIFK